VLTSNIFKRAIDECLISLYLHVYVADVMSVLCVIIFL